MPFFFASADSGNYYTARQVTTRDVAPQAGHVFYTVSVLGTSGGAGTPNNGADFGPDTKGTTTGGLQEAVNAAKVSNAIAVWSHSGVTQAGVTVPANVTVIRGAPAVSGLIASAVSGQSGIVTTAGAQTVTVAATGLMQAVFPNSAATSYSLAITSNAFVVAVTTAGVSGQLLWTNVNFEVPGTVINHVMAISATLNGNPYSYVEMSGQGVGDTVDVGTNVPCILRGGDVLVTNLSSGEAAATAIVTTMRFL